MLVPARWDVVDAVAGAQPAHPRAQLVPGMAQLVGGEVLPAERRPRGGHPPPLLLVLLESEDPVDELGDDVHQLVEGLTAAGECLAGHGVVAPYW
ncbi:hypothetical protein I6A84_40780 [Frankia sp. CNm7]|uniref:hypothetical protein n=1 Tax=Frankia nepalensis TaxID=1836974 RepID=UPI00193175B7|nr:hypothetical protein [Frankia nepalensis]MBL7524210.1 hypothetical protein [Frankia nepalensis]